VNTGPYSDKEKGKVVPRVVLSDMRYHQRKMMSPYRGG
jgi:hypothetical protein